MMIVGPIFFQVDAGRTDRITKILACKDVDTRQSVLSNGQFVSAISGDRKKKGSGMSANKKPELKNQCFPYLHQMNHFWGSGLLRHTHVLGCV